MRFALFAAAIYLSAQDVVIRSGPVPAPSAAHRSRIAGETNAKEPKRNSKVLARSTCEADSHYTEILVARAIGGNIDEK
jgi:hypothetical protein